MFEFQGIYVDAMREYLLKHTVSETLYELLNDRNFYDDHGISYSGPPIDEIRAALIRVKRDLGSSYYSQIIKPQTNCTD
jgi:hypothetical protein